MARKCYEEMTNNHLEEVFKIFAWRVEGLGSCLNHVLARAFQFSVIKLVVGGIVTTVLILVIRPLIRTLIYPNGIDED